MDNKGVIITFETLWDILKKEKLREDLQKLEKTFFADVVNYLRTKKSILDSQKSKNSIFASTEMEKTTKQIQNTIKMIKELYDRRESKIVQAAILSARTDKRYLDSSNMLPEEQPLFNELLNKLTTSREQILNKLLEAELPTAQAPQSLKREEPPTEEGLVKALADIPQFVFSDMNIYGPFAKGEAITAPEEVVRYLTSKNQVEIK